jgi:hypothetical protein
VRLPDSERSRAVLVGTSSYPPDSGFEPLPTVTRSLANFKEFLQNETGLRHITVIENPPSGDEFSQAILNAAEDATDVLLFYYAGHGVVVGRDDLGLTHMKSRLSRPGQTTLRYSDVRDDIRESRASTKVVILDCCHSGRAFSGMMGSDATEDLKDIAVIEGAYVLTSTDTKTKFAAAVGPWGCTAFTGTFLKVLLSGSESAGEFLSMERIFPILKEQCKAANYPLPKSSGRDTGSALALARNPLWKKPDPADIRDAQLAERYAQGVDHLKQQHWQQAVEVFGAIEQERPGYRDAAALLTIARRRCKTMQSILVMAAALIAAAAITGAIPPIVMLDTNYEFSPKIWFFQTVSRILIVVAFCVLTGNASSAANKFVKSSAYLMVSIILLQVINDILVIGDFPLGEQAIAVLDRYVGPILLASAALVASLFGIAVIMTEGAAWAFILMVWGLCGLVEASLMYKAKMRLIPAEDADHLLLAQNFILLAVAVLLMSRAFRPARKVPTSARV